MEFETAYFSENIKILAKKFKFWPWKCIKIAKIGKFFACSAYWHRWHQIYFISLKKIASNFKFTNKKFVLFSHLRRPMACQKDSKRWYKFWAKLNFFYYICPFRNFQNRYWNFLTHRPKGTYELKLFNRVIYNRLD